MCYALAFLYASGRLRTLRVVTHTPKVAAWRAVREAHLLVQAVRHKTKAGDTLSSRHVSLHKTYVLSSTPFLSLPMRWLSYADLCNLVTW